MLHVWTPWDHICAHVTWVSQDLESTAPISTNVSRGEMFVMQRQTVLSSPMEQSVQVSQSVLDHHTTVHQMPRVLTQWDHIHVFVTRDIQEMELFV